jgi:hypothetical protein
MRALFALLLFGVAACSPAETAAPVLTPSQMEQLAVEKAEIAECGYVGCRGPFHAAPELDFGAFAMGAIADVPRERMCSNTSLQGYGHAAMCGFRIEGISHVTIDGKVIGKSVNIHESPPSELPFGLEWGQAPEQTLAILRAHTRAPFSVKSFPDGMRYVSNDGVLTNENGYPFLFSLIFVNDGLAGIMLQDPSAPPD